MGGQYTWQRKQNDAPSRHRRAMLDETYLKRAVKVGVFNYNEATMIRRCRMAHTEEELDNMRIVTDFANVFLTTQN